MTVIRTQLKKKIILFLLIVASLASALLLINHQPRQDHKLTSLAQADSIILATLNEFNVYEDQVSIQTVKADTGFYRTVYNIKVPRNFAASHWHYTIHKKLDDYQIQTPGRVNLKEKKLNIHLLLHDTIFRTLRFEKDTTRYQRYFTAHLFLKFDRIPDPALIQEVVRLGEPIPIILPVSPILDMKTPISHIYNVYPRVAYQLGKQQNSTDDVNWKNVNELAQKLDQLKSIDRTAKVFIYKDQLTELGADGSHKISRTGVQIYNVDRTIKLDADDGRAQFSRQLRLAVESAREGDAPLLIVEANGVTLNWLHEFLPEYRKKGLLITNPPLLAL